MTQEQVHRPFLITKRVVENDGCLWGVVAESNNQESRIRIKDMLGMVLNGVTFLVDYKGADKPAILQVVHHMSKDQLTFYFKTVGDSTKKNNFKALPEIKYLTSKKFRILKK
jgi:hypothetical protein